MFDVSSHGLMLFRFVLDWKVVLASSIAIGLLFFLMGIGTLIASTKE